MVLKLGHIPDPYNLKHDCQMLLPHLDIATENLSADVASLYGQDLGRGPMLGQT